jgi:hypothetical protein
MPASTEQLHPISVYLELGAKRVFASAADWPGWCRSGKGEEQALEALVAVAARYAVVAREAGFAFPTVSKANFRVAERLPGSATTDFGAPSAIATDEAEALSRQEAQRLARLLQAAWTILDRVVAGAPAELRKGPRGGGRDRDRVFAHVVGAEVMYARKLGIRMREPAPGDIEALTKLRDAIVRSLESPEETVPAETRWLPRYAARRIAWHVLDHAWEIEDRSG